MGTKGFLANSRENSIALKTPRKKDVEIRNFRNARITGWAKEKFDDKRYEDSERETNYELKILVRYPSTPFYERSSST